MNYSTLATMELRLCIRQLKRSLGVLEATDGWCASFKLRTHRAYLLAHLEQAQAATEVN